MLLLLLLFLFVAAAAAAAAAQDLLNNGIEDAIFFKRCALKVCDIRVEIARVCIQLDVV